MTASVMRQLQGQIQWQFMQMQQMHGAAGKDAAPSASPNVSKPDMDYMSEADRQNLNTICNAAKGFDEDWRVGFVDYRTESRSLRNTRRVWSGTSCEGSCAGVAA